MRSEREFDLWCAIAMLALLAFWEFAGLVWALVALRRARRPLIVYPVVRYPVFVPYLVEAPPAEALPADDQASTDQPADWDPINDPDGWKNR